MSTRIEREGGGYFTCPNRWYDAGYAKQVPATITSVYMFLCRWEGLHMEDQTSQPIPTIARQCGCSPDVARDAVRVLEEWGVLHRTPARGPKGENVWLLKHLEKVAPDTPYEPKKGRKTTPQKKNEGSEKNHGEKNEAYQPEVNQPISSLHEDSAAPDIPPTTKKPMPRHGMAQTLLAVLHEDVLHIPPPTNYGRAMKDADTLAKAGCTPDEIHSIAQWLINDPFWGPKGVTINRILTKRDEWLSAKANTKKQIKRFVV